MIRHIFWFFCLSFIFLQSCVAPNSTFEKLPPGIWRGVLLLDRQPVQKYGDDRDVAKKFDLDSELPFNFEVVYDDAENFHIILHNGTERIVVNDIKYGRDKATAKDTIVINFPVYDTYITAIHEDGVIEGDWVVNYRENYKIPFKAVHGVGARFTQIDNADTIDVSGTWNAKFEIGSEDEYPATGIFNQQGRAVTGTFLTETGDYRFLDGTVFKNKMYLSAFDGAHAFLFIGKKMEDGSLSGSFRSGSQYTTNWEATKETAKALADPFNLTKTTSHNPLQFSFVNESGVTISLSDEQYKGKAKIIQIMGTWCPNCMDETIFLKEYFAENPMDDVALISIGFERYLDEAKSLAALKRYKDRMDIKHEVLLGGYYDKKSAQEKIPQLDKIISYPTLLFVDQDNNIIKIHTGFNGPATPGYQDFKKEFGSILDIMKNK